MPPAIGRNVTDQARGRIPCAVKIVDVAAAAGVAPMTVSRVINTPDRVSEATTLKVRAAIERLGYVPNLIAGGLSSRRSRMIAAIVPTIASPMFSEPVQTFTDVLGQAGYHVMLGLSGYAPGGEDGLIHALLARRPDGILLTGARHSPVVQRLLRNAGIPVVEIWDATDTPTDMLVGFDHAELGAAVAEHFLAKGHTRFAVFAAGDPRATARRDGYVRRIAERGGRLVAERTLPSPSTIMDGRQALREIIDTLTERTALFGSSDMVAFGALTEARALHVTVPDRLAICGFGDFELSRSAAPAFTTVSVDGVDMGRIAAENLLARMQGGAAPRHVLIPARIVERATT